MHTYLGFDLGQKRIGVAIGNDLTMTAHELTIITNNNNGSINWQAIEQLLAEYKIHKIIVGLALNEDGSEQLMTRITKNFSKKCTEKFGIEVIMVDEFLTSNQAKQELQYNHYHKNADRGAVDKRSAQLILQQYFNDGY